MLYREQEDEERKRGNSFQTKNVAEVFRRKAGVARSAHCHLVQSLPLLVYRLVVGASKKRESCQVRSKTSVA